MIGGSLLDRSHEKADEGLPMSEQIVLVSAGIDIGSSTSHLMISSVSLRRDGIGHSSRFVVVDRDVLYRSPVLLTPYETPDLIDAEVLGDFFDSAYREAGVRAEDIDTGAVIITGEAAKKKNADRIIEMFARHAGKFVCAVAGPMLEASLAVHGSGSAALSKAAPETPVLNIDIGGGTTKISLLLAGNIEERLIVNVGARLLAWDENQKLIRIESCGAHAADTIGAEASLGAAIGPASQEAAAEMLVNQLFEYLLAADSDRLIPEFYVGGARFQVPEGATVVLSGGVSEYVYNDDGPDVGDMGRLIAKAATKRLADAGLKLERGTQQLRSTVVGASQYSVQVSGSTIFLQEDVELPLYNVPVLHVRLGTDQFTSDVIEAAVTAALETGDLELVGTSVVALAFHAAIPVSYGDLLMFGNAIARAVTEFGGLSGTFILLEQDIAGLLGHIINEDCSFPATCIDQVSVVDLDYIDIGSLLPEVHAVPLVAKSLIFA